MGVIFFVCFIALIAVMIQVAIHIFTKKKPILFIFPVVCAVPTIYILLNYGNVSILSKEADLYLGAFAIGIPASFASLLTGIIIVSLKAKK